MREKKCAHAKWGLIVTVAKNHFSRQSDAFFKWRINGSMPTSVKSTIRNGVLLPTVVL